MNKRSSSSRLFLTEMMFAILFFVVIVGVCTQVFAQSYIMSKQANEKAGAVNVATNAAEYFLGDDTVASHTEYYDSSWMPAGSNGEYKLVSTVVIADTIKQNDIVVIKNADESVVYELTVKKAMK